MTFHLKAKGDEMEIACSIIEETDSTGTDLDRESRRVGVV